MTVEAVTPTIHHDVGPDVVAALVWRFPTPRSVVSTAAVGGGVTTATWIANIGVVDDYRRTDLDEHVAELARMLALDGPGVALLTAADVAANRRHQDGGVAVDATVGVTKPTWAADAPGAFHRRVDGRWTPDTGFGRADDTADVAPAPGTINLVVQVPVPLHPGAAVNAVATATEAKTQALVHAGVPGTGTASDAVVIVHPMDGEEARFAGPRSRWGARIARATHAAVRAGVPS